MEKSSTIKKFSFDWFEKMLEQRKAELADMQKKLSPETMRIVLSQLWIHLPEQSYCFKVPIEVEKEIEKYYLQKDPTSFEKQIRDIKLDLTMFDYKERPLFKFQSLIAEDKSSINFFRYLKITGEKENEPIRVIDNEAIELSKEILSLAKKELESPERNNLLCMLLFRSAHSIAGRILL